jgi:hypothetical protein
MLHDDLIALELRVDLWKRAQGGDRGLDEKRGYAEPDAMCLGERLLLALPHIHDRRHVHLVEGGQHGRGALRLDEAASDCLAPL